MNNMKENSLKNIPTAEFDYVFLLGQLSGYKKPRNKITNLLKEGSIVRVKKGLYVMNPERSGKPFSKETLANLIYGPSYISLEYALSYYGMIPERVETVTSVTNKKNKFFKTPVGAFSYLYLNQQRYAVGITRLNIGDRKNILIAEKEKALADKIFFSESIENSDDILQRLVEDLRIDEALLHGLNLGKLNKIAKAYKSKKVTLLCEAIKRLKLK